jgi:hypothetical protein
MKVIVCLLVFFFLFFGCTSVLNTKPLTLSIDEAYLIAQSDKDFNDFKQMDPNFVPTKMDCNSFSQKDFALMQEEWTASESVYSSLVAFFEPLNLTQDTVFCVFSGKENDKYSLVAVIDQEQRKSVMIAAVVRMNVGVGE